MYVDQVTGLPVLNIIEIDDEIYPVLKILWDKGYKTKYSCAGHNDVLKYKMLESDEEVLKELLEVPFAQIYIYFAEVYSFDFFPESFMAMDGDSDEIIYEGEESRMLIENIVNFYDDEGNIKDGNLIEKELLIARKNLLMWASKIPCVQQNVGVERKMKI